MSEFFHALLLLAGVLGAAISVARALAAIWGRSNKPATALYRIAHVALSGSAICAGLSFMALAWAWLAITVVLAVVANRSSDDLPALPSDDLPGHLPAGLPGTPVGS